MTDKVNGKAPQIMMNTYHIQAARTLHSSTTAMLRFETCGPDGHENKFTIQLNASHIHLNIQLSQSDHMLMSKALAGQIDLILIHADSMKADSDEKP